MHIKRLIKHRSKYYDDRTEGPVKNALLYLSLRYSQLAPTNPYPYHSSHIKYVPLTTVSQSYNKHMRKAKTILITGPESSGKTTLAKQLAENLGAEFLPEYARTYLEQHGPEYEQSTLLTIAKEHTLAFDTSLASNQSKILLLDTFLLNIKIWSEEKYESCDSWILDQLTSFRPDGVLLCKPDIPWKPDPLRENPLDRDRLFAIYQQELDQLQWNYLIIDAERREKKLKESVREFISKA